MTLESELPEAVALPPKTPIASRSSDSAPPATRISPEMSPIVIFSKSTFRRSVLSERFKLRGTSMARTGSAGASSSAAPPSAEGMASMISFKSSSSDFT